MYVCMCIYAYIYIYILLNPLLITYHLSQVSFQDLLTHPLIGHLHEKFPVAKHGLARPASA